MAQFKITFYSILFFSLQYIRNYIKEIEKGCYLTDDILQYLSVAYVYALLIIIMNVWHSNKDKKE